MFNIGQKIRNLRKLNHLTLKQLADKVNLTQPQLSRLENGVNTIQIDTLLQICKIFNVSIADFFSTETEIIPDHFREFFNANKELTPKQLNILSTFIRDFSKSLEK